MLLNTEHKRRTITKTKGVFLMKFRPDNFIFIISGSEPNQSSQCCNPISNNGWPACVCVRRALTSRVVLTFIVS